MIVGCRHEWAVGAVHVELKVIGVGMKGNVWVVGKDLEQGEEVNVKTERTNNRILGNTMGDKSGGGPPLGG